MLRILLLLLLATPLHAQIIVDCGETFYDPGGELDDYSGFDFQSYEICPTSGAAGDVVTITFSTVDLAPGAGIDVYNGVGGDYLGTLPNASGQVVRSTALDGCLTLDFFEFNGNTAPGFVATVSCAPGNDCIQPASIFLDDRTATSATINWGENGSATVWDVAVLTAGTPFSGTATTPNSAKPHVAAGLTSGQAYDFYVRSDCGSGDFSEWSGPFPFEPLPPPPANDECADAINVPISADDNCAMAVSGSLISATPSPDVASGCSTNGQADVWYVFTANATSAFVSVSTSGGGGEDEGDGSVDVEIFAGDCGGLTSLSCLNEARLTSLTSGANYYIRIVDGLASETDFTVCVYAQPDPPANDDCDAPVPLTPSVSPGCTSLTPATTAGATNSLPECGAAGAESADDDVWFSFTATSTTQLLYLENVVADGGFDRDMGYEVFSGTCGSPLSVVCGLFGSFDDPPVALPGLTAGAPYLLRIYTDDFANTAAFDICLATPPANDECNNALALPINEDGLCTSVLAQTTLGATRSGDDCGTARADDDLWYTFTATNTTHLLQALNVENAGGGLFVNLFYELSTGTNCGTTTVITCSFLTNEPRKELTGLTVGETYFLRIFTRSSFNRANFDLCLSTPPDNDDCAGAFPVNLNPDLTNTVTNAGSTLGATMSLADPASFCSTSASDDDVWFSFTALAETHIVNLLNVNVVFMTFDDDIDAIVRLYDGDCTAPNGLACDFINNDTDDAVFSGLTPGETYFLTVESQSFDNEISFDLSIRTDPALLPVRLISFTGQAMDKYNQLNWRTATEENTEWHILQRSTDGITDWTEVARTQGAGWSNEEQTYSLDDPDPTPVSFYRLLSRDFDGAEQLSGIVRLEREVPAHAGLTAFPNPVGDALNITLTPSRAGELQIDVIDITGREVLNTRQEVREGLVSVSLDLSGISQGSYLVRSTDGGGMVHVAWVVKR